MCASAALLSGCGLSNWADVAGPVPPNANTLVWGSGIFVSNTVVLTAKHTVDDCLDIRVASPDGRLRGAPAELLAKDKLDIALIKLATPAPSVAPARFAVLWPSDAQLTAYTDKFPTLKDRPPALPMEDTGPIIGLGYTSQSRALEPQIIQTRQLRANSPSAALGYHFYIVLGKIRHGDSGGPLVDSHGAVIGMMFRGSDTETLRDRLPDIQSDPLFNDGVGIAFAASDLLAVIARAGVTRPPELPTPVAMTPEQRATESLARVFCFRR